MGKQERNYVEALEKTVVLILNNAKQGTAVDEETTRRAEDLASYIRSHYEFTHAEHIGNTYGVSIGDIKLVGSTTTFVELKFLKDGTGTRANMSQNALSSYGMFRGPVMSWSEYRDQQKHTGWVFQLLSSYKNYPFDIAFFKASAGNIKKMARVIRDNSKRDSEALRIKETIVEMDRREKLAYLQYLSYHEQNEEHILRMIVLLLTGRHTAETIKPFLSLSLSDTIGNIPDNYHVIYVYKRECGDSFACENMHDALINIAARKARICFPEQQTNAVIELTVDGKWTVVLRFSLHWKNVFQGIATPCLNVFDENLSRLAPKV